MHEGRRHGKLSIVISKFLMLAVFLASCVAPNTPTPTPTIQVVQTNSNLPLAEAVFIVEISPGALPAAGVFLDVLDETTGLALNPSRYVMQVKDATHFLLRLPLPLGAVIKYRYFRNDTSLIAETNPLGKQVRYRLYYVAGPGEVQDLISGWTDRVYHGPSGRIIGKVVDSKTNNPVSDMLVTAGGMHTLSGADGTFILEGLPPATHNLDVYSLDGSYQPFQQGAAIAKDSSTPVDIKVDPAVFVNVTFTTRIPDNSLPTYGQVRMVGNIFPFGNTFTDLAGGISTIASRAPVMERLEDGRYSIKFKLPVGLYLEYKYTLGDGFWDSEHDKDNKFRLRQLIVPSTDIIVDDIVEKWQAGNSAPMLFNVTVPTTTPPTDIITIQFNPYGTPSGWTEPIPMWQVKNKGWQFVLYNPLNNMSGIRYRYCRNAQCGVADDNETRGFKSQGFQATSGSTMQVHQYSVTNWAWMDKGKNVAPVVTSDIRPRNADFWAGIEFTQYYQPSWQSYFTNGMKNIDQIGANLVVIPMSWTFTQNNPPILEALPGKDPLSEDVKQVADLARQNQKRVVLFPRINYPGTSADWWQSGKRDVSWWESWFDRYETYILHQAALANQIKADALILGGGGIGAALPGGRVNDVIPSKVPYDIVKRWKTLIAEVRSQYKGTILWAVVNPAGLQTLPTFISDVDQLYLIWSAPLSNKPNLDLANLTKEFGKQLDKTVKPFVDSTKKPVILALEYASADGAITGCIRSGSLCIPSNGLSQGKQNIPTVKIDFAEQANIYSAALSAVNTRLWISGVVSRGYYPPAALLDSSTSIHGKPASDVLWYWYPKLTKK